MPFEKADFLCWLQWGQAMTRGPTFTGLSRSILLLAKEMNNVFFFLTALHVTSNFLISCKMRSPHILFPSVKASITLEIEIELIQWLSVMCWSFYWTYFSQKPLRSPRALPHTLRWEIAQETLKEGTTVQMDKQRNKYMFIQFFSHILMTQFFNVENLS